MDYGEHPQRWLPSAAHFHKSIIKIIAGKVPEDKLAEIPEMAASQH